MNDENTLSGGRTEDGPDTPQTIEIPANLNNGQDSSPEQHQRKKANNNGK